MADSLPKAVRVVRDVERRRIESRADAKGRSCKAELESC